MTLLPFLVILAILGFGGWLLYAIFENTADTIREHRHLTEEEKMKIFSEAIAEQKISEGTALTEEEEEEEEEE